VKRRNEEIDLAIERSPLPASRLVTELLGQIPGRGDARVENDNGGSSVPIAPEDVEGAFRQADVRDFPVEALQSIPIALSALPLLVNSNERGESLFDDRAFGLASGVARGFTHEVVVENDIRPHV
jgi:hypothetical protein